MKIILHLQLTALVITFRRLEARDINRIRGCFTQLFIFSLIKSLV